MGKTDRIVYVTDSPYNASGDGVTNDRGAIQKAIDDLSASGGGTVILTPGRSFLVPGIVLRSGVDLVFGDGAVLIQSPDDRDYTKPVGAAYEPYAPVHGHNFSASVKWSHAWYRNYPLVYAPEGSGDFSVSGHGTVRMMEAGPCGADIKICPFGFYRCHDFKISGVHITNYSSYGMLLVSCAGFILDDITIDGYTCGNTDGICLANCRHVKVTNCDVFSGDDALYIFSSYRDPRGGEWWSTDEPDPSEDIEIAFNELRSNHCKALGFILWGNGCPDPERIEIRDVDIHDNHIETLGIWGSNPFDTADGPTPVTHVRFRNNRIDGIERNFFCNEIMDMNHFHSGLLLRNGSFSMGRCFWSFAGDSGVVKKPPEGGEPYSFAGGNGRHEVYQGLFLKKDSPMFFRALVRTEGNPAELFVRATDTGEIVASAGCGSPDWKETTFAFSVPKDANYQVGIGQDGSGQDAAYMKGCVLGTHPEAFGHTETVMDHGVVIFKYSEDLFRR